MLISMTSRKRPRTQSCAIEGPPYKRCPTTPPSASTLSPSRTSPTTAATAAHSSLPLTRKNLSRLQYLLASTMGRSRPSSPSRTKNNLDTWDKLAAFDVHVDTGHEFPAELKAHLEDVIQRPRNADAQVSPNAKQIARRRRLAAQQNERTGIKYIEPYMLFRGEADMDDRVSSVPNIASKDEVFLNKYFCPQPPNASVKSTFGELSQPRSDSCVGYVTRRDAQAASTDAPFSLNEERTLQAFPLTQYLHFPFLTSQWKAQIANENMLNARYQAARDGAVVVNYLSEFYRNSEIEPSTVQTCHFSLTCDLESSEVWVHWREGSKHHMELVCKSSLRQVSEIEQARNILRNIVEYSLGERLDDIKKAILSFANVCAQGMVPTIPQVDCATASVSSLSASAFQIAFPMTPSSLGSGSDAAEPVKKRKLNITGNG